MIAAFVRAFAQLPEPAFRGVLFKGLAAAAVAFVALGWAVSWAIETYAQTGTLWLDKVVAVLGPFAVAGLAWVFFPPLALAVISIFTDDIAEAVERRHYPDDPPGRAEPIWVSVLEATKTALVALLLNLVALPLYLVPGINFGLYVVVNGLVLGRDLFGAAARRHLDRSQAASLRKAYRWRIAASGAVLAALFAVPGLNLLAPLVGMAAMVHIFKGLSKKPSI